MNQLFVVLINVLTSTIHETIGNVCLWILNSAAKIIPSPTPPHPSRSVVQHANDNYYNDDEFNDDKNYSGDDDVDENNLGSVCCF